MARVKKKVMEMREVAAENLTDFEVVYLILRDERYSERTIASIRDYMHCFDENHAEQTFEIPYRSDMDAKTIRRIEIILNWIRCL